MESKISQIAKKILFVDDEETILEIGEIILQHGGYQVMTALSGEEALEIFSSGEDIDLVLLDLSLPGISGRQVFEKMWEMKPGVKVILASGFDISSGGEEMLEMGAKKFIQKPYHMTQLLEEVKEVIEE